MKVSVVEARHLSCLVVFFLTSCSWARDQPDPPPFNVVSTTNELMHGLVEPLATVIFDSAIYVNGVPVGAPETDEEWEQVIDSALGLAETGNLLMLDGHRRDQEAWIQYSNDLIDSGIAVASAARTQDIDTMLDAGSVVWEACLACHERYIVEDD